jgi:hypothetical protein
MASTKEAVKIPSQFQPDQPRTPNEVLYDEDEEKLEGLGVPKKLIVDLNDAVCWRVNDAYDFGVAWGLGQFPELEFQGAGSSIRQKNGRKGVAGGAA